MESAGQLRSCPNPPPLGPLPLTDWIDRNVGRDGWDGNFFAAAVAILSIDVSVFKSRRVSSWRMGCTSPGEISRNSRAVVTLSWNDHPLHQHALIGSCRRKSSSSGWVGDISSNFSRVKCHFRRGACRPFLFRLIFHPLLRLIFFFSAITKKVIFFLFLTVAEDP